MIIQNKYEVKMNFKLKLATLAAGAALLFSSCGDEKIESKNMQEIYKDNGVPVKVEKVKKGSFQVEYTYNTYLTGNKESSAYANIGDRVEKIYVKVGDYVKKDQLLAKFPTDNPSAKYYQAKLAFENSKKAYNRYKNLFETGGIARQELDNIKTQMEVDKANFKSVSKLVKVLSPMSGRVTKINVRETENVKKESLLFTIADVSRLKGKINVTEDEIGMLKKGLTAKAVWMENEIAGKVVEVDFAMNMKTQAFNATIEFDNSKNLVKAGVSADITVNVNGEKESIITERKNVTKKRNDYFIFLAKGNRAVKQLVKIGRTYGMYVEIIEGIKEGDIIVTEGQFLLQNNTKINIVK